MGCLWVFSRLSESLGQQNPQENDFQLQWPWFLTRGCGAAREERYGLGDPDQRFLTVVCGVDPEASRCRSWTVDPRGANFLRLAYRLGHWDSITITRNPREGPRPVGRGSMSDGRDGRSPSTSGV